MNLKILNELTSQCELSLSPAESERMVSDLTSILAFVDQIHTLPTNSVVPLVHPINTGKMFVLDEPEATITLDLCQREATMLIENFYLVPKVIEP